MPSEKRFTNSSPAYTNRCGTFLTCFFIFLFIHFSHAHFDTERDPRLGKFFLQQALVRLEHIEKEKTGEVKMNSEQYRYQMWQVESRIAEALYLAADSTDPDFQDFLHTAARLYDQSNVRRMGDKPVEGSGQPQKHIGKSKGLPTDSESLHQEQYLDRLSYEKRTLRIRPDHQCFDQSLSEPTVEQVKIPLKTQRYNKAGSYSTAELHDALLRYFQYFEINGLVVLNPNPSTARVIPSLQWHYVWVNGLLSVGALMLDFLNDRALDHLNDKAVTITEAKNYYIHIMLAKRRQNYSSSSATAPVADARPSKRARVQR